MNCTRKSWSWQDVWRSVMASAFVPRIPGEAPGTQINSRAIKLVVVEDSGEPYFCSGKRFESFDQLAKELTGLYSESENEVAIRVSLGTMGAGANLCDVPRRSDTELEMGLSVIGKGTDGKPVVRLAFALAMDTESGSA